MNKRKLALGDRNLIGQKVTEARRVRKMTQKELLAQLQLHGIDISLPALSLLEGQKRPVYDKEADALSKILGVTLDWLFGRN